MSPGAESGVNSNLVVTEPARSQRPGALGSWRFLPVDQYPRVVAFAQEPSGKAILLVMFAVLLRHLIGSWGLSITIGAAACAFAGRHRPYVLTAVTIGLLYKNQNWWFSFATEQGVYGMSVNQLHLVMLTIVLIISWALIHCVRRFPNFVLARRPVPTLIVVVAGLLAVAASRTLHGVPDALLWAFIATFAGCLWFLCYALTDQARGDPSPPVVRLGAFHAFWGSTSTPFGKGMAYLRKIEAKSPPELAVTQLKAVKLLAWLSVLQVFSYSLRTAAGFLQIPSFDMALTQQIGGNPFPAHMCWASLVYTFLYNTLDLAIWGGIFVSSGRMAGYRLLRNTYRPLSARTIAEFWNRYYYYYKELLVDLFFFPTFLRCFKQHKRLRLFFATVMAAGVGNFVYHVIRDYSIVAQLGIWRTVVGYQTFAFYCAVLSVSIGVSQLRSQHRKFQQGWLRGQLVPSLSVILFYCLLEIFMVTYSPHSLGDRFLFLFRLFGIDV